MWQHSDLLRLEPLLSIRKVMKNKQKDCFMSEQVKEFVNYMEELETAHQAKVRMIKPINVFGYIKIKYEVLEKEGK